MKQEKSLYEGMTRAEKEIAAHLRELDFWWRFEHPIFIFDEMERPRVWTPDFYLPELGVYIEVCGSKDFEYEYRARIYKKNRIPVIFLHQFKNKKDWKEFLKRKLIAINQYRQEKMEVLTGDLIDEAFRRGVIYGENL